MWHNFFMLCLFWCGANSRPFATATVFYFFRQWHGGAHGQLLFFVIHLFSAIVSKKRILLLWRSRWRSGPSATAWLPSTHAASPSRSPSSMPNSGQLSSMAKKNTFKTLNGIFFMTIYYLGTPSLSTTCRPSSKSRTGGRSTSEWVLKFWTIRSNI